MFGWALTFVFVVLGIGFSPVVEEFQSIYQAVQNFFTFVQGPSLAVLLLGMLWRRTTAWGGFAGLAGGLCTSITLFTLHRYFHIFAQDDPFLYVNWWTFVSAMIIAVTVSLLGKPKSPEELKGLVYDLTVESEEVQDAIQGRAL